MIFHAFVATHSIEVLSKTNKKARKKKRKKKKEHLKELKQPTDTVLSFVLLVLCNRFCGCNYWNVSITYLSGNNINIINYENELIDKYLLGGRIRRSSARRKERD